MAILGGGPLSSVPISGLEGAAAAPQDFILGIEDGSNDSIVAAYNDLSYNDAYQGTTSQVVVDDVVAAEEPLYSPNEEFAANDYTEWSDWSWAQAPPITDPEIVCTGPKLRFQVDGFSTGASYNVTLPPLNPGDLLTIFIGTTVGDTGVMAAPSGWTTVNSNFNNSNINTAAFVKYATGAESGTSVTVNTFDTLSHKGFWVAQSWGNVDTTYTVLGSGVSNGTSTTFGGSGSTGLGSSFYYTGMGVTYNADDTVTVTKHQNSDNQFVQVTDATSTGGQIVFSSKEIAGSSGPYNTGTLGSSAGWVSYNIWAKGICADQAQTSTYSNQGLDGQDFTDFADYGTTAGPLPDDVFPAEDFLLGTGAGLDDQDFTDAADYGSQTDLPIDDNFDIVCSAPILTGRVDSFGTAASYTVTLPGYSAGDLLIGYILTTDTDTGPPSLPAGWTSLTTLNNSPVRIRIFYRYIVSDIGPTVTVNTFDTLSHKAAWVVECYSNVDSTQAPHVTGWSSFGGSTSFGSTGAITPSWGTAYNRWISAVNSISDLAVVSAHQLGENTFTQITDGTATGGEWVFSSFNAAIPTKIFPSGTWTASNDSSGVGIVIRGLCVDQGMGPPRSGQGLDDQDFTDLADYGFSADPLSEDVVALQDFLIGISEPEQDYTDFADYGSQTNPYPDDNNPEVAPSALDDQDFSDLSDYGTQTDQPVDDNNPEVAPSALDDQDFTDPSDYGTQSDPLSDAVVATVEDFLLGTGDGVDDQDFTDTWDYGSQSDPLSEDVFDPVLGVPDGLDAQDFTDTADYGTQTNPPIDDNNPEVAPSALDDQDFTDFTDYGTQTDQAIDDNNPDIAPSALDDQDRTDTEPYGTQTDQAIPDNNPELAPSTLDDQDFTDFTDYGVQIDVASDTAPEDALLGDGQGLDDQDFTDFADYGSQSDPLSDDAVIVIEDFILGYGSGLDEQDWTDYTDYSFVLEPNSNYADVSVLVTGGNIVVGIGCFEVISWIDIPDVSSIWTGVPEPTMTWNPIAEASNSWSDVTEPTNPWVDISDPANTWTEEC